MATVQSGYNITKPATLTGAIHTVVGGLSAGTYGYGMTFVTNFGETNMSTPLSISGVGASGSVKLTSLPASPANVINRKLYRTAVGGSTYFLLATLDVAATTEYVDVATDASLPVTQAPAINTASSLQVVNGDVSFSKPLLHSVVTGLTARAGGGQALATPLTAEYNLVATVATAADSVLLPLGNTASIGRSVVVKNAGIAAMAVFPGSGQTINAGAADASVSVATTTTVRYVQTGAAAWTSF